MSKIAKTVLILFLLYTLLGFFLLPKLLLPKLQEILNDTLNASTKIESLYFNPLTFTARISGVSLKEQDGKKLLELAYLEVDVDPTALLFGTIQINTIVLQKPQIYARLDKEGAFNLTHMLKEKKNKEEQAQKGTDALPHIFLSKLSVEDARIDFLDNSKKEPFHIALHQLFIKIHDIDTHNLKEGGLHLQTKIEQSGHIEIYTKVKRIEPLTLQGSFGFEIGDLSKEFAYIKEKLNIHLTQGRASFFTKYTIDTNNTQATELSHMNFSLYDLKTAVDTNDKEVFNIDYLYVNDINVKPFEKKVAIPYAGIKGLMLHAVRKEDASIDWMHYLNIDTNKTQTEEHNSSTGKDAANDAWDLRIANLALDAINIRFDDRFIQPPRTSSIDKLSLQMQNITLLGEEALAYQLEFFLNKTAKCALSGSLKHQHLDLKSDLECKDIDIAYYRPYIDSAARQNLRRYNLLLQSAKLDTTLHLHLTQKSEKLFSEVRNSRVVIKEILLHKKTTQEQLLSLQKILIDGIYLDTKEQEASVALLEVAHLRSKLTRYKSGKLNLFDLVEAKKSVQATPKQREQEQKAPMHFALKEFALTNAQIDFTDKSLSQKVQKHLRNININVYDFDTKQKSWFRYKASMYLHKGGIFLNGKVRHTPLQQKGSVAIKNLAIGEINPYLQEKSYLKIEKGKLSLKLQEQYRARKKGADMKIAGALGIEDFLVFDENDGDAPIFGIQQLKIDPLRLELFPNRLTVDEVLLKGLYVAAKIDENKTINFAKLMKQEEKSASVEEQTRHVKQEAQPKDAFLMKIAKVDIKDSQAFFRDFSIPIKFQTDIHNINGQIEEISNIRKEITSLHIDGEVDAYGSMKIDGSLDSFHPKRFTDVKLDFQNLDLSAMSGYSASFAGYKIASGKLFLDLEYKIQEAKLHANNTVVIKQIKLGEALEGENIHHLPLGFVLALLEDSNGVIDIELPIEGNLDNPDFKYGAVVWNTLTNLITKAVSSPFRFLGSMLGLDTDKLGSLHFAYAKAEITPPEREKLDTIAKIMKKRPKILLSLTPVYDEVADKQALQREKLFAQLSEKTPNAEILEEIYSTARDDDKIEQLKEKLHQEYKDEDAFQRAYTQALIQLCSEIQSVSIEELEALAKARATAVKKYLMKKGIILTRIVVKHTEHVKSEAKEGVAMPLSIEVQSSDK